MGERECVCGGCGSCIAMERSAAPTWDPYSPVAAYLWRGADFAELGNTSPMVAALYERVVPSGDYYLSRAYREWTDACSLTCGQLSETTRTANGICLVLFLRQLAEFGPAGRPRQ